MDFISLFTRLYAYGLRIVVPMAALFLIIGGVILLTASGYSHRIEMGKNILNQVIAGLIIVLLSWVIVDTAVFLITNNQDRTVFGQAWWGPSFPEVNRASVCSDDQALAERFGTLHPAAPHEDLVELMDCIERVVPVGMIDRAQIYTIDRNHPTCNYTRGDPLCDVCSHTRYSCHYGGRNGQGAMAVDYNASGGNGLPELQLYNAILNAITTECTSIPAQAQRENPNVDGDHTHVWLNICSN